MKRTKFLRIAASGLVAVFGTLVLGRGDTRAASVVPSDAQIEYVALNAAIEAMNRFGATKDGNGGALVRESIAFWPYIYATLGSFGFDTSWPTAKRVGDRFYDLRNELIQRANVLHGSPSQRKEP
jgi:hypothetical protein